MWQHNENDCMAACPAYVSQTLRGATIPPKNALQGQLIEGKNTASIGVEINGIHYTAISCVKYMFLVRTRLLCVTATGTGTICVTDTGTGTIYVSGTDTVTMCYCYGHGYYMCYCYGHGYYVLLIRVLCVTDTGTGTMCVIDTGTYAIYSMFIVYIIFFLLISLSNT